MINNKLAFGKRFCNLTRAIVGAKTQFGCDLSC